MSDILRVKLQYKISTLNSNLAVKIVTHTYSSSIALNPNYASALEFTINQYDGYTPVIGLCHSCGTGLSLSFIYMNSEKTKVIMSILNATTSSRTATPQIDVVYVKSGITVEY